MRKAGNLHSQASLDLDGEVHIRPQVDVRVYCPYATRCLFIPLQEPVASKLERAQVVNSRIEMVYNHRILRRYRSVFLVPELDAISHYLVRGNEARLSANDRSRRIITGRAEQVLRSPRGVITRPTGTFLMITVRFCNADIQRVRIRLSRLLITDSQYHLMLAGRKFMRYG